jgi:hypothetical protein
MPYLGSTPNASFSSRTKQDFTANGSTTAFTLSSAVASANDIEVFVGNVRQEPTDAYTVNGTTLTMSEAPATGLNFYVVFKGLEENSVVPADGSISSAKLASTALNPITLDTSNNRVGIGSSSPSAALDVSTGGSTKAGIFTGNGVDVKHPTLPSHLTLGTQTGSDVKIASVGAYPMLFHTNGTERIRIDASGNVTTPYQPAFSAYGNNQSVAVNTDVDATLPNEEFDAGNNYNTSTSRFTAPVAGRYLFTGAVSYSGIGTSHIAFRVNNAFVNNGWTNFGDTESAVQSRILNLAAGDYVNMRLYSSQGGATNGVRTRMTGCLLS